MVLLYYCVVLLILMAAGPFLLLSKKAWVGLDQKLGIIPSYIRERFKNKSRPVWFHAVSVGEFNAVWPLIDRFHKKYPQIQIVISTTTATGQKLARERAGNCAEIIYFPLDVPWSTGNWLNTIRPSLVAIVETELWPGFLEQCSKRQIPVVVINGRMSPRSFRSYKAWKVFFAPLVRKYALIAAQSESEAQRYREIAGNDLPIKVVGNLKFDKVEIIDNAKKNQLLQRLNIGPNELVLVAGSTHEGEETALIKAYTTLVKSSLPTNGNHFSDSQAISNLRLVLVPRHPERCKRIAGLIEESGFRVRRFSRNERLESCDDVLLVDTIGHLSTLYSIAHLAFVGGTLTPIGGHNLAEPYVYAVPVICGPHVHKTQDVATTLAKHKAISILASPTELLPKITQLLVDPQLRQKMGTAGNRWLLENAGAVDRTLMLIESILLRDEQSLRTEVVPNSKEKSIF